MAYASLEDFSTRYTTKLSDAEVNSHYLAFASARLDSLLAPSFTVPFSANNLTARDLTIDLAYLLILQRSKEAGDSEALKAGIEARVKALRDGKEAMLTDGGDTLLAVETNAEVWSNNQRMSPLFQLDEME